MSVFWMNRYIAPRLFFAKDAGGGSGEPAEGENEGEGEGEGESKTFTQADLDKKVKERLSRQDRKYKKEMEKRDADLAALQAKLDELTKPSDPPTPDPGDIEGRIKLLEGKHEREIESLRTQLSAEQDERKKEHARRLETERDRDLMEALQGCGCIDPEIGRRIFLPQIEYDQESEDWFFNPSYALFVQVVFVRV